MGVVVRRGRPRTPTTQGVIAVSKKGIFLGEVWWGSSAPEPPTKMPNQSTAHKLLVGIIRGTVLANRLFIESSGFLFLRSLIILALLGGADHCEDDQA
jgi:hypothetical protein